MGWGKGKDPEFTKFSVRFWIEIWFSRDTIRFLVERQLQTFLEVLLASCFSALLKERRKDFPSGGKRRGNSSSFVFPTPPTLLPSAGNGSQAKPVRQRCMTRSLQGCVLRAPTREQEGL